MQKTVNRLDPEKTDEQLMKLYKGGDETSFKLLYERHSSKIYGFIKSRVHNQEKTNEIYQEVFMKIHRSKSLYNESLPLLPWIFTVTRSVLIDELRKEKKFIRVDIESLDSIITPVKPQVSIDEASSVLTQLPEIQKRALELRYINEKTFEQIAVSLSVKPSNARQIISRGLRRLKELSSKGGLSD